MDELLRLIFCTLLSACTGDLYKRSNTFKVLNAMKLDNCLSDFESLRNWSWLIVFLETSQKWGGGGYLHCSD